MSEIINHNSESLATLPSENQWNRLAEVPFNDGEAATSDTAETSMTAKTEPIAKSEGAVTGLQVIESAQDKAETYRPVSEMEKSEIAREYMDLLHSLSDNFTSPEAVHSAVMNGDGSVQDRRGYSEDTTFIKNLYKKNGLALDETNNFNELRENGQNAWANLHYENEDLDRAHTLKMVDSIRFWRAKRHGAMLAKSMKKRRLS